MPQFKLPVNFSTSSGQTLKDAHLHYECIGNPKGDLIWVCHALTGNTNIFDWWPSLFKENGGFIDLSKHYVVCANSLGSCYGSFGPDEYEGGFPEINHRDVIEAFHLLKEHLQIKKIDLLIGGSLGGQQALEWSISYPEELNFTVLVACNAWHSSWGIAWNELQRNALALGGGKEGLALARKIAMLSYRSAVDFEQKTSGKGDSPDSILSYLKHQGNKFIDRFSVASYQLLSQMMDQHDIRKGRLGTLEDILGGIQLPILVVGINSDVLFPLSEQQLLVEKIPNAKLAIIDSTKGHDAFLLEGNFISREIEKYYLNRKQTA